MLTIITPSTSRALTTVLTLETALQADVATLTGDQMALLIDQASSLIAGFLGTTLASETVQESIRPRPGEQRCRPLLMSRWPITALTSVVADGTTLTVDADFEADLAAGLLWRLSGANLTTWTATRVVVTYTAGYALPAAGASRTLPVDIETCAIDLVRHLLTSRSRDPALRSQAVLNGLVTESYYQSAGGSCGLPSDIAARLAPYRVTRL